MVVILLTMILIVACAAVLVAWVAFGEQGRDVPLVSRLTAGLNRAATRFGLNDDDDVPRVPRWVESKTEDHTRL